MFTYRCDDLDNSTLGGRIGYYNDSCNFIEHPLSMARMSFMVACENEEVWSNIVYNLTPGSFFTSLCEFALVLFPACPAHQRKGSLVTLVEFLGIGRMVWEDPIRLLDFACHVIFTFKTMCDDPLRGVGPGDVIVLVLLACA